LGELVETCIVNNASGLCKQRKQRSGQGLARGDAFHELVDTCLPSQTGSLLHGPHRPTHLLQHLHLKDGECIFSDNDTFHGVQLYLLGLRIRDRGFHDPVDA
jgi:hypothetical protein